MKQNTRYKAKFFVLFFSLAMTHSFVWPQVSFRVGAGAGVVVPLADYGGGTFEYYSGAKYGLTPGFNVHGKARLGLFGFRLTGEVAYASLSNEGNAETNQGLVTVSQKILSVKLGPEYELSIPLSPVTPYVGVNVALNRLSGETTFQGVSKVSSGTYSLQSATRFGLGVGVGVFASLNPFMNLDIGIDYNLMNLFGKAWEDVNPTQDQRLDSYLTLNDDKDPQYAPFDDKHFVGLSRNIHTFQISITVMFGI